MKGKIRSAIVSDIIITYGGAEKVLEVFLEMFPESDLYTLFITPNGRKKIFEKFPKVKIHTSVFQFLVKKDSVSKYISVIKFFSWLYWEFLDLKKYDLVVSSSHSYMSKNIKKRADAYHVSYIHTPPRYLYNEYCELNFIKRFPINILIWPLMFLLRKIDYLGSKRPDIILVNSENVKRRVMKYYGRKAMVLYPPVGDLIKSKTKLTKKSYYVCLSRLVKQKGIALAVKVCSKYKLPLYVVGYGGEYNNLKKIAGKSVRFIKECNDLLKEKILSGAKALIYTSIDEDFGIVPIEALSLGVPVIAYKSGGVKETIKDGLNGVFFKDFSEVSLKMAIDRLNNLNIKRSDCLKSVKKYSLKEFKRRFLLVVNK